MQANDLIVSLSFFTLSSIGTDPTYNFNASCWLVLIIVRAIQLITRSLEIYLRILEQWSYKCQNSQINRFYIKANILSLVLAEGTKIFAFINKLSCPELCRFNKMGTLIFIFMSKVVYLGIVQNF